MTASTIAVGEALATSLAEFDYRNSDQGANGRDDPDGSVRHVGAYHGQAPASSKQSVASRRDMNAAVPPTEFWKERLKLPTYRVSEAARYADVSSETIRDWQKLRNRPSPLGPRERGKALSYLQLIELAVVAAARDAGVPLWAIRETREYMRRDFDAEFPFAEYRFKTDGKKLWIDYMDVAGKAGRGKLLEVSGKGQLAWAEIIGRLQQFEYDRKLGLAVRWHVAGRRSPVIIDPRIRFGAPSVDGVPTRLLMSRWEAGESPEEIADDFEIAEKAVSAALKFEGAKASRGAWQN